MAKIPGIRFQTVPDIPKDTLPRMDIAAFVGFASSGPIHIPVPVEDMNRFRDIFGSDLPLALDESTGKTQYAFLSQAVGSFFKNGGRRCWIIRVADAIDSGAEYNRFSLPGLAAVYGDTILQAEVRARAKGSWSDDLKIGAILVSRRIELDRYSYDKGIYEIETSAILGVGDLLKLDTGNAFLILVVDSVKKINDQAEKDQNYRGSPKYIVQGSKAYWISIPSFKKPLDINNVFYLSADGEISLPARKIMAPDDLNPHFRIELIITPEEAPYPGSLLRINIDRNTSIFLTVSGIESIDDTIIIKGKYPQCIIDSEQKPLKRWVKRGYQDISASILSFELFALHDKDKIAHMKDLSLVIDHPRFFGNLPTDEELFSKKSLSSLDEAASIPRFPFASSGKNPDLFLPLGMPSFFDPEITIVATESMARRTALERDGLSTFSPQLFLDPSLASPGIESLLNDANTIYYQEKANEMAPLTGIHSLLPIEEVTLIAVPDAVHTGWKYDPVLQPQPLSPPVLEKPVLSEDKEAYIIKWNKVVGAYSYTMQESSDPLFENIIKQHDHRPDLEEEIIPQISIKYCPKNSFFRICAKHEKEVSGWSNTIHMINPLPDFVNCMTGILPAPKLLSTKKKDGWLIEWEEKGTKDDHNFSLQESIDPGFLTGVVVYKGKDTTFLSRRNSMKIYYYRVRVDDQEGSSPWSNTINITNDSLNLWVMITPEDYDAATLMEIQGGLLRFCRARADMLAVLSLPRHYHEAEALSHKRTLVNFQDDKNITSFGALYHPWLYSETHGEKSPETITLVPPDGAVCGKIASISISGAAWLSPANVPVEGTVSIRPLIDDAGWERLFSEGINLIRHESRGFLIMSASTLSKEPMISLINVRRLLILLRRLSLREGSLYTFQSNDEDFRRLVHQRFEMLLGDMHVWGAFAGKSPEESFRVVTDSSINTIQSIEQGRFIIELRVAPSFPMTFITVRLIQTGTYGLLINEV